MSESEMDAVMLTYYLPGRVRDPEGDPGRIRRLKDVGYLSCTMDLDTGEEFLKTTESGVYEVMLNSVLDNEEASRLRRGLEKALGLE